MKRIFVPTTGPADWQRLLAKPSLHWKLGRSAMTAAVSWEDTDGELPAEIRSLLDASGEPALADLELLAAIPEWAVHLAGGTRASNTDVLALTRNDIGLCVMAVEAKVTEDFGPRVGEKRRDASEGQSTRMAYLHEVLEVDHFEDSVRYQLLHRTASAHLTARAFHAKSALMLVHAFGTPEPLKQDFYAFVKAIGGQKLGDDVFKATRANQPELYLAWCKDNERYLTVSAI